MKRRKKYICYFFCSPILLLHACSNYSDFSVLQLLTQAETVMQESPDFGYSLLSTVEVNRIEDRALRARYALLYTQALEKTDRPVDNDSLINVAVDYYNRRQFPLSRAYSLYYQGCIREKMNTVPDALRSFMEAQELATELKEDYLSGLISVSIAELYQQQLQFGSAIDILRQALGAFQRAEKERHLCYALIMMGRLFLSLDVDSSAYYCRKAYDLSIQIQDIEYEHIAMINVYNVLRKQREFEMAKDLLSEGIQRFGQDAKEKNDLFTQLGLLYYEMGQLDSARLYISRVEPDSLDALKKPGMLLLMKLIEEKGGNDKAALAYYVQYKQLSDSILFRNRTVNLKEAEAMYAKEKLRNENRTLKTKIMLLITGVLGVTGVCVLLFRRFNKRLLIRESDMISHSQTREELLKQIVERRFSVIKGLLDLTYIKNPLSRNFIERFRASMALAGNPEESFFADLLLLMNDFYFGIIDWLKERYRSLNQSDLELISLLYFKFSPQELCSLYGLDNVGAIYTRCHRVAKKLKFDKSVSIGGFLEKKIEELRSQQGM